jgi:alpha-galactosidase
MRYLLLVVLMPVMLFSQTIKKENLALTPPMGWNSWNTFRCDGLNEQLVKEIADIMASNGMKEAGYEYINLDDCWQIGRDENGVIIVDSVKFPSGIKALADYVHSKGLKFGIYSDAGLYTCEKRPGGFGYEEIDAKTYAEWGVDYLKYDFCFLPVKIDQDRNDKRTTSNVLNYFRGPKNYHSEQLYMPMAEALAKQDRDIVFSLCNWGSQQPWLWAGELGHLWRTTGDIRPYFKGFNIRYMFFFSIMKIINFTDKHQLHLYAGPGRWNDPDMLEVGNGKLTQDENIAHFSMWAMMAAPLLAGNDLRTMNSEVLKILTNKKVIEVNQDALGKQGYKVDKLNGVQVWIKPLQDDKLAVCFLNPGRARNITFDWNRIEVSETYKGEELWDGSTITTQKPLEVKVPKHGVKMYVLKK